MFELSCSLFEMHVTGNSLRDKTAYKKSKLNHDFRAMRLADICIRSKAAVQGMMVQKAEDELLVNNFLEVLPLLGGCRGVAVEKVVEVPIETPRVVEEMSIRSSVSRVRPSPPIAPYKHVAFVSPKTKAAAAFKEFIGV